MTLIMMALLVLGCNDYDLKRGGDAAAGDTAGRPPDRPGGGGSDTSSPEGSDTALPPTGETGSPPTDETGSPPTGESCVLDPAEPWEEGVTDRCVYEIGGFTPTVVGAIATGEHSLSTPAVGDLDGDGVPEIIANVGGLFSSGELLAVRGDTLAVFFKTAGARIGYASPPAVADVDGDGAPEIVIIREYASSLLGAGDYTAVLYGADGLQIWESEHFTGDDFDYATAPSISDMDHDGVPEVVAGRVILSSADGSTLGVGAYGRGAWLSYNVIGLEISEGSIAAVVDLDLDGQEEVVVGNAIYSPGGGALAIDPGAADGMVAIANLDADPEGEVLVVRSDTVEAKDTDLSLLWSLTIPSANIVSPPAVGDLDGDGRPEIVVAGGDEIYALNHDGSTLWSEVVHDETGASGAAIFDFEADGYPEVVYIDEVQLIAFDGLTGEARFQSDEHSSSTMGEYPVIADVDGDGHAEVLVPHQGESAALSVYEDAADTWAPTRAVWNQHAYCISNVLDDLQVPTEGVPGFMDTNTWHAAASLVTDPGVEDDLEAAISDICALCDEGQVLISGHVINRSPAPLDAGIPVSLYARIGWSSVLLETTWTADVIPSGWASQPLELSAALADIEGASALWLVVDDDGSGAGVLRECSESNNTAVANGPFCAD